MQPRRLVVAAASAHLIDSSTGGSGGSSDVAPVLLPAGARNRRICLESLDKTDPPSVTEQYTLSVRRVIAGHRASADTAASCKAGLWKHA